MTDRIQKPPKWWLDLKSCEIIYNKFKNSQFFFGQPLPEFSDRFPNKLEGILGSVQQSFDGTLLFPTVLDAALGYFFKINLQHPFKDGNKRMCVLFTDVFLLAHQIDLQIPYGDVYKLATQIAKIHSDQKGKEFEKIAAVTRELFINTSFEHQKPSYLTKMLESKWRENYLPNTS